MRSNRPLRIAIYDPSGRGGICHYTFQLAESLAEIGCDVTVITTETYELKDLARNFKVRILFKKSWLKSWLVKIMPQNPRQNDNVISLLENHVAAGESQNRRIADFLKNLRLRIIFSKAVLALLWSRPHLIHFQWLANGRGDLYFIKLLKLFGFKIVYTAHDLLPHDMDIPENRRFFQNVYELADRLIVHADNIKEEMIGIFDIDPIKIYVIPHGSNTLFFSQNGASKQAARDRLGIPLDKKVILFFGLIKPYKGLEYLLEAFKEIKEQVENVMLVIAGRVADEDTAVYYHYCKLLTEFADNSAVRCVTEYIPFDEVGYFFSTTDVVVLPHVKPSQSGVLLSAIAAGKPVVVTDAGGLSEVVNNAQIGFVVPPKDAKALAKATIKILKTPGLLEQMGREAKILADTTYSWKTVATTTINVYQTLNSPMSG